MADNIVTFDRVNDKYSIDCKTVFTGITNIDVGEPVTSGYKLEIDTGDGSGYNVVYDNSAITSTNYTVTIGSPNTTVQNIQATLFKDSDGALLTGSYKFTFYEKATLTTGTPADTQIVTNTIIFDYDGEVTKKICLNKVVSCIAPSLRVYDAQDYDFNTVSPTITSPLLTVEYPNLSNVSDLTTSTVPLEISSSVLYDKGYSATASMTLNYDFTTYVELLELSAELDFIVNCTTVCCLYDSIAAFRLEMNAAKGVNDVKYTALLKDYTLMMSYAEQIDLAVACDKYDDVTGLLTDISNIIKSSTCTTTCSGSCESTTIPRRIYGIGSTTDMFLEVTNGTTTVTQVTKMTISDGLELTSTVNNEVVIKAEVTQAELDVVSGNVTTNTTNIGTNATNISNNATNISANDTDISNNTSLINARVSAEQSVFACGTSAESAVNPVNSLTTSSLMTVALTDNNYYKVAVQVLAQRFDNGDTYSYDGYLNVFKIGGTLTISADTKFQNSSTGTFDLVLTYTDVAGDLDFKCQNTHATQDYTVSVTAKFWEIAL